MFNNDSNNKSDNKTENRKEEQFVEESISRHLNAGESKAFLRVQNVHLKNAVKEAT